MTREVWVVGASKGLGRELARIYASEGRTVIGMSRGVPPTEGDFEAYLQLDVSSAHDVNAMIARLYAAGRRPELVVYMAASVYQGSITEEPEHLLRRQIDTNYLGFVHLCKALVAHRPDNHRLKVVATASTLAYVGCPSLDNYSASKAALISFARSARAELSAHGLSIQIVSPPHMTNGGADLVGPQPFSVAWSARHFARTTDRNCGETILGRSNGLMVAMSRFAPRLAARIMHAIGLDALQRGAVRLDRSTAPET
ncbi:SDR family oxidoreductase [Bradyrhizobium sp.]|uniref:SDR family NAD(P)-dependent oxidoreductase n=1 Tax=Bradyrhizobium sp. TaxID=376 RepID=UPI00271DF816|nr:SDR family NAD(P)-dependent oxidoreductase [Bradyrhizobium sp.]MDO9295124.1 SDR family NAD(P)-dependent oxidoreductase [Bradyrhizobium sp.]